MKKGAFHSSGRLDVEMLIGRFRLQRFEFTAGGVGFDVTRFTWQLNIKQNAGNKQNYISLSTGGYGLSFPIYETNVIEARFEAAQVSTPTIQEGCCYWELVRTDTNEIWVSGNITFKYGLLDSGGEDQDVTVNLSSETVVVELDSIVQVNTTTGGGGGVTEWYRGDWSLSTLYPGEGQGSGTAGAIIKGDTWRIVLADPLTPVTIGGRQYLNGQLLEAAATTPGQTTLNWNRIIT